MSKIEIDTLDLMESVLAKKDGFIIIVNNEAENKIHHYSCTLVQKEQFIKKVLNNEKKNIKFVWVDSAEEATGDLKAEICMNCIAPMRTFLF